MSTTKPMISIIIIIKNSDEVLLTLKSLAQSLPNSDTECIVIDASTNATEALKADFPWAKWYRYQSPKYKITIAGQRNKGIELAQGKVIVFIDAGCVASSQWLEKLTRPILDNKFDATCGPIRSQRPGVYTVVNGEHSQRKSGPVPTGNIAFSRFLADVTGPFDETFAYGSDTDWTLRAQEKGFSFAVVGGATVTLDFGGYVDTIRRSFRYGRGRTRMLRLHPRRISDQFKRQPDYFAYPLFHLGLLVSVSARVDPYLILSYSLLLLVPLFRNIHLPRPDLVLLDHLLQGLATLYEVAFQTFRKRAQIIHFPDDPLYVQALKSEQNKISYRSDVLTPLIGFQPWTLLNLPLVLLWNRIRGMKVFILHWTWAFGLGNRAPKLLKRLARYWFEFILVFLKLLRVQIVWVAHNVLPHSPVFDSDEKARRFLSRTVNTVIAHHSATAKILENRFGANPVYIVPQGMTLIPKRNRDEARRLLRVPAGNKCVVFIGRIEHYKGLDTLVRSLKLVKDSTISVRIGGECTSAELKTVLEQSRSETVVDCQISYTALSEKEFITYLSAADVVVLPFRDISNSGSALTALSAGRRLVVPSHESLDDLPEKAVFRYWPPDNEIGLAVAIANALGEDVGELKNSEKAATDFAALRSWELYVRRLDAALEDTSPK